MKEKKTAPAGEGPGREELITEFGNTTVRQTKDEITLQVRAGRVLARMAAELEEMLNTDFTRGELGQPRFELRQIGSSD